MASRTNSRVLRAWTASILFLVATAMGCGGADDGSEVIDIFIMADLSGPTRQVGQSFHAGRMDRIAQINGEGGIRERSVRVEVADTEYDASKAFASYIAANRKPFWSSVVTVFGYGAEEGAVLNDRKLAEGKVPYIAGEPAPAQAAPLPISTTITLENGAEKTIDNPGFPYTFLTAVDYSTTARAAMEFIGTMHGRRIGFCHCSVGGMCTDPLDAARAKAASIGLEVASTDLIIELDADAATVNAAVAAYLKAETVDWLWVGLPQPGAAHVIEASARDDVRVMVNPWALDEELNATAKGTAGGRVYGATSISPFGSFADAAGMYEVLDAHRTFRADGAYDNIHYVAGYASVVVWEIAVEQVLASGDNVTRGTVLAALERMAGVNTGGLSKRIHYSREDHRPALQVDIYQVTDSGALSFETSIEVPRTSSTLGW